MTKINATEGVIDVSHLKRTLVHEHVLAVMPGWQFDHKAPKYCKQDMMLRAVDRLQELREHGCNTIVDPCPIDIGRDVEFVAEASQKSGVTIICASGVYTEADGIPSTFRQMPLDEVVELYVKEIEEGIGNTGIKAGVLKIATGIGQVSDYEKKMITAAARASLITGVPIISHTDQSRLGIEQIDLVAAAGASPAALIVGHSGDRDDSAYQKSIGDRGAFIGLDRFGAEYLLSDEIRMHNLITLLKSGYRDRVLISQDHVINMIGRYAEALKEVWTSGLDHIFKKLVPRLYDLGMSEEDFDVILVQNPKGYLRTQLDKKPHVAFQATFTRPFALSFSRKN